jgi:hypothetical protein
LLVSQAFSYSAGGIFLQAEWSLSLLYQETQSAVASVTSLISNAIVVILEMDVDQMAR